MDAFALKKDGSFPPSPETESDAVDRATRLDPLGNSKPTESIPSITFEGKEYQSMRLEGGLQLHPSCELEAIRKGHNVDKFKKSMNSMMQTMLDRMVKCTETYPEMKSYVEEAISQYRRQVVRCEPPKGEKGMIKSISIENYWAYNDQKTITITSSLMDSAIPLDGYPGSDKAMSSFFHELLHSTSCNNRHDHNEIETKSSNATISKDSCKENVTMDRVSVVESLCMGVRLNSSKQTASQILAHRMAMCGKDRGCRDLFTARGNNFDIFTTLFSSKTRDFKDDAATRLCQRIKDDGMCLHFRKSQGKVMTESNPKIKEVRRRLQDRINNILPGVTNKLPTAFLALYPDLNKRFDALKGKTCFKRHFYSPPDKPNDISALRTKVSTIPADHWSHYSAIPNHFSGIAYDYSHALARWEPDAECNSEEIEMKAFLNELTDKLDSNSKKAMIPLGHLIRANEKGEYPDFTVLRDTKSDLVKLLGEDLVIDYMKTMDELHHESPTFNCTAAGLTPFRSTEAALKKPNACE